MPAVVKKASEVPAITPEVCGKKLEGVRMRVLIGPEDGAPNFIMRLFELDPGAEVPLHTHDWEHEVYVLEGEGELEVEGRRYELTAGMCAFVPPGVPHAFRNTSDKTWKFLCLIPRKT